jgi:hypothetical protein
MGSGEHGDELSGAGATELVTPIIKVAYFSNIEVCPWSRLFLEKLRTTHLSEKIPSFYETQRILTAFTRAHQQNLS